MNARPATRPLPAAAVTPARTHSHALTLLVSGLLMLLVILCPEPVRGQKTDVVTFRNGDQVTGEIVSLDEGRLQFKTDGMKTVYAQWPKVVTVATKKRFEIVLQDGTIYFGSLEPGVAHSVVIKTDSASVDVPTQWVVRLDRRKPTFWIALEGSFNIGFGFTQQNAKTDLNVGGEVSYPRQTNLTRLDFNSDFTWQNDVSDIFRLGGTMKHLRQFKKRWFYLGFLTGSRNSQLGLESRISVGGGLGRMFVETNKMGLAAWIAPGYAREQYSGESVSSSVPLIFAGEFKLFIWDPLDTEVSSRLGILPIVNEGGRWRINFNVTAKRELWNDIYLSVGVSELYDSRPPAIDANKNDFSITSSFGFSF